jgi:hypothetical protein
MQEIFGLGPCTRDACNANDLSGLFTAGAIPSGIAVTTTPEPSTWGALLVGAGLLIAGRALLRRRNI